MNDVPSSWNMTLKKKSLYSVLSRDNSVQVHCVKRLVEAVEATGQRCGEAQHEKRETHSVFTSVGFNAFGEPIEFSLARYRGDRSSFEVTVFTEK